MPIYEYKCTSCGEPVEKLQKLSDAPLTDCPACGQPALKRKVSAAGFRLSGGGWYETDFKSDKRRNLSGDQESSKASSAKDSSSKDKSPSNGSSSNGESKPKSSASNDKPAGQSGGETKSSSSKSSGASSD